MSGFFDALALLTRVPTRGGAHTERAVPWLPVVGAAIGGAVGSIAWATHGALGSFAAAAVAVGAGVVLTGALHEDGLADTADAFGAGVGREATLAILKDPRHGTYGVLALVVSILVRVATVASLDPRAALAALPAAHGVGRGTAAWMLTRHRPATPDGLGATYAGPVTAAQAPVAITITTSLAGGLLGLWAAAALVLAGVVALVAGRWSERKIGGITGDVLGAAEQVVETGVLLLAVATGTAVPWWRS